MTAECKYCRGEDPVLCEGHCVHCGREVTEQTVQTNGGPVTSGMPVTGEYALELTYREKFALGWPLVWRGGLVGCAAFFAAAFLAGISGATAEALALWLIPAIVFGTFVVAPWLGGVMLNKRFRGFSLVVLRDDAAGETGISGLRLPRLDNEDSLT